MQDQVAKLKSLGIGAEYLGSAQTAKVRTLKEPIPTISGYALILAYR